MAVDDNGTLNSTLCSQSRVFCDTRTGDGGFQGAVGSEYSLIMDGCTTPARIGERAKAGVFLEVAGQIKLRVSARHKLHNHNQCHVKVTQRLALSVRST